MNSVNKKNFKIWEFTELLKNYERALLICTKIEQSAAESPSNSEATPMSIVPTEILYELMICYQQLYTVLLDESLSQNGHPKTTFTQH
jgi:predicted metal-binding protein